MKSENQVKELKHLPKKAYAVLAQLDRINSYLADNDIGDGIYIEDSQGNEISNNEIFNLYGGYQCYGIHLKQTFTGITTNNEIINNDFDLHQKFQCGVQNSVLML